MQCSQIWLRTSVHISKCFLSKVPHSWKLHEFQFSYSECLQACRSNCWLLNRIMKGNLSFIPLERHVQGFGPPGWYSQVRSLTYNMKQLNMEDGGKGNYWCRKLIFVMKCKHVALKDVSSGVSKHADVVLRVCVFVTHLFTVIKLMSGNNVLMLHVPPVRAVMPLRV